MAEDGGGDSGSETEQRDDAPAAPADGSPTTFDMADAGGLGRPIRRWFWLVALGAAGLLVLAAPLYVASNVAGDSGIDGLNGPGGSLFGNSYMPVLPILVFGFLVLCWNPGWRWSTRWWGGAGHLVVRGRELLLLCATLYAVAAVWDAGRLKHLFVNESFADRDGKNPTWTDLKAGFPDGLGVPAMDDSRRAEPPDEAAIRLAEGLRERGDATLLEKDREELVNAAGWRLARARWRSLTMPTGPPGHRRTPLAVALRPVFNGGLLILVAAVVIFGILGMTARQWTHHERLQYPLVQVPLALTRPSLLKNRGFQIAFFAVLLVVVYNFAKAEGHHPLPAVPYGGGGYGGGRIPLVRMKGLYQMFGLKVPGAARWLYREYWGTIFLSPMAVGLAFLIALDVGFSLWSGFFFGAMICGWLYRAGIPVNYMHHGQTVGGGAALTMAAVILWIGRHHYWRLLKAAVGIGRRRVADRAGVWGLRCLLLGGLVFCLLLVLLMHGFDPWSPSSLATVARRMDGGSLLRAAAGALICLLVFAGIVIVSARIVAETGFAILEVPIRFWEMLLTMGLPFLFPVHVLVLMSWIGHNIGKTYTNPAGFLVQARTMGERAGVPGRRIFPALFAVVAGTVLIGTVVLVIAWWVLPGSPEYLEVKVKETVGVYEYMRVVEDADPDLFVRMANRLQLETGWFRSCFEYLSFLTGPRNGPKFFAFLVGAGLVLGCFGLRRLWVRFPFHPLGIVIGLSWPIYATWGSLLLGWLAKLLVLRYGGAQLYARLKPVAIGLIFGEIFAQGVLVAWRSGVYYF